MRRGVPAVPLIHDNEIWEKRLATLPLADNVQNLSHFQD